MFRLRFLKQLISEIRIKIGLGIVLLIPFTGILIAVTGKDTGYV